MEIGIRLNEIASMVENCDKIADIGTDHAYIPIYLIQRGICKSAIASDINKGPVEKAKGNVKLENLEAFIECRLGGGFSTLKPSEAQAAIIAGMGGNLIRDIIEEGIDVFRTLDYCILQPVQNPEVLREYIYKQGYSILDEELCIEDGKYYEIIKVKYDNNPRTIEPIYYEVGQKLLEKRHPLIFKYISYKLEKYYKIYNGITDNSLNARVRKSEVMDAINKLKELLV
jgi:tRNA (adenine22-N1)-methyltransferase